MGAGPQGGRVGPQESAVVGTQEAGGSAAGRLGVTRGHERQAEQPVVFVARGTGGRAGEPVGRDCGSWPSLLIGTWEAGSAEAGGS